MESYLENLVEFGSSPKLMLFKRDMTRHIVVVQDPIVP
jgi:hypothetical protein